MLELCPNCHRLSVEYDTYHQTEKCLHTECQWINRGNETLEKFQNIIPSTQLSSILESRNLRLPPEILTNMSVKTEEQILEDSFKIILERLERLEKEVEELKRPHGHPFYKNIPVFKLKE